MEAIRNYGRLVIYLRNADHVEFYSNIIWVASAHESSMESLGELMKAFTDAFEREENIFMRSRQSGYTAMVREAGKNRRDAFRLIKWKVESARYDKNTAVQKAVNILSLILHNYKEAPYASMTEASALLTNMVQDLRLPKYAGAVETLGLQEAADRLGEANELFRAHYAAREYEQGVAIMEGNMKYIRRLTDKAFAAFANALGAFCTVAGVEGRTARAEALGAVINSINSIIHNYHTIYAHLQLKI
ncbi:MAG: DUF6261 family protein [Tannerellaceae bacterium]|jgi:hypothetical protein|nr:DUF6261 family protein [Tannerellaceae bacterium]